MSEQSDQPCPAWGCPRASDSHAAPQAGVSLPRLWQAFLRSAPGKTEVEVSSQPRSAAGRQRYASRPRGRTRRSSV